MASSFKVGLTQEEKELYSKLFKSLDPQGSGIVTGEKARATFEKSGLPPNILGEIWQLADALNMGFLTQFGFCYAMRLIGYTQAGLYPTAQLADSPGPLPKFANMPALDLALNPQATSGSLLHSQPSSLVPQNTATQLAAPLSPIAPVSAADYERFSQMFVKTTGSPSVPLDGNAAKSILMKAKLPTMTLGQIWSLVDVNNRGFLDLPAFVMAMHLIHGLLSGSIKQLPPFLPEVMWKSVDSPAVGSDRQVSQSSISSQLSTIRHARPQLPQQTASEWAVTPLQKQQFDSIFESLDKQKSGALASDQVASFLMTSRLDQGDLATIWDLADIQNTGIFSKLEFGIALFLINRRRAGHALPAVVPQELILSLQSMAQPAGTSYAQKPVSHDVAPQRLEKPQPKSNMDDLAGLFGPASPPPADPAALTSSQPHNAEMRSISSSSNLTPSNPTQEMPRVRLQLTSSFKPTSSFGQSLVTQKAPEPAADLIGDDILPPPAQSSNRAAAASPVPTPISPQVTSQQPRTVDYEALRHVPPPPKSRTALLPQMHPQSSGGSFPDHAANSASPLRNVASDNTDLLADNEVSGKLSEANSDIANLSNQIRSLTTQTSNLHEKKVRAEQELTRILGIKEEINSKLKTLRTSYASEVKQVEQVEINLKNSREEMEALRSEASIAEAKFNSITNDFHEKQLAVEENQKINAALKEKLGNLNAEIAELEKEVQSKAAENDLLSKDANVKKSQVQVALVNLDSLRSKVTEAEAFGASLQRDIQSYEATKTKAETDARDLETKHAGLNQENQKLQQSHLLLGAGVGAVMGAGAAALFGKATESDANPETHVFEGAGDVENVGEPKAFSAQNIPEENAGEHSAQLPGLLEPEISEPAPTKAPPGVAGMVDEVIEAPAQDLTGIDDNTGVASRDDIDNSADFDYAQSKQTIDFGNEDMDALKARFPDVSADFDDAKRESTSSAATESYKPTEAGETAETPITSPANSDYRFQAAAGGIAGGMVGMPGVLIGVQRTDSLTSSVQNNPANSVRDDNIEEVSDRDTIGDTAAFAELAARESKEGEPRFEESSEGERLSSGVELFEIVNADDANAGTRGFEQKSHPLSQSYRASESTTGSGGRPTEEFPSPQELDFEESSSDESGKDEFPDDQFDDAKDSFGGEAVPKSASFDEFSDLKPAVAEAAEKDDFFDDEFDNLKVAEDDHAGDFEAADVSMDDHFTGAPEGLGQAPQYEGNDEWEELFAGFGNAPSAEASSVPVSAPTSHDLAVQELVAMGFERSTVILALERENYDVEAATNYLLDNA